VLSILAILPAAASAAVPPGGQAPAPGGPAPGQASPLSVLRGPRAAFLDVRAPRGPQAFARSIAAPAARGALLRSLGRSGLLETDPATGTPRVLTRLGGYLTGTSGRDPEEVAMSYVEGHLAGLGLEAADLEALRLVGRETDEAGVTHLEWEQRFHGVPAFQSGLKAAVDAEGRLLELTGAPQPRLAVRSTNPQIGARTALTSAQLSVGGSFVLPAVRSRAAGPERATRFADGSHATLVLFGRGPERVDLAWRVLDVQGPTAVYDTVVDAATGDVLYRQNIVDSATANVWQYFPNADRLTLPGGNGGGPRALTNFPSGADPTSGAALNGAYAHVYTDVDDNANTPETYAADAPGQCGSLPQACGEIPQTSAGVWNYAFNANPGGTGGFTGCEWTTYFPQCSWGLNVNASTGLRSDGRYGWSLNIGQNGTEVYWLVSNFHNWLAGAPFGFTGAEGFEGADKVNAQILDGADTDGPPNVPHTPDADHVDNANMAVFPGTDTPPRMQMYLFTDEDLGNQNGNLTPEVNGGDDASVLYHEYTHGLSNRLVTSAPGQPALGSFQSGAMGEGWSDWYAMDYIESHNLDEDDTTAAGQMNMGYYVEGGDIHALRTEGLDCPAGVGSEACPGAGNAGPGGYTYGDLGRILCGEGGCIPEVHADGEIWAQTLWDLRTALRAAYGDANSTLTGQGTNHARAIVTEAMRLSPPNPSMVDMRNAILQADQALYGGADTGRIWDVFRARGMGYFASTLSGDDTSPVQDFSSPPNCAGGGCGQLSGTVVRAGDGAPVQGAVVQIPGPPNLVAVTDSSGHYAIGGVPAHTYPYILVYANGYDTLVRQSVAVSGNAGLDVQLERDWAAVGAGAQVSASSPPDFSEFGCGPAGAFDGSQSSGWGSTSPTSSEGPGGEKQVTVQLPQAIDISRFAIDPGATCGDDDSASTNRFRIEASPDGAAWQVVASGDFDASANHRMNTVVPSAAAAGARYVRFWMEDNQGPIGGEGTSYSDFMDSSEVEVYGSPHVAEPAGGGGGALGGGGGGAAPSATVPPPSGKHPGGGPATALLGGVTPLPRQRIATLLSRGLKVRVACAAACRVSGSVTVTKGIARKLHTPRRIGGGSLRLSAAGRKTMTLRLSGKAKRAIRRRRRRLGKLPVTVRLRAAGGDGSSQTTSKKVTLRR
jgi:hypothetical protein